MLKKDWNYPSKKCSFSPKALRKIHWWTYISPQKMCPASLTTFWYFGHSAPSPSVTLVFSPTTFRNSIGNFVNELAGTFHFYSDPPPPPPPLWMSTLSRQLVGIRFQRDRQKDQRVPTKKWGGRNLLIHRGGSEINGTSQEERDTLLLNSAYLLVGAMRKSYQNA